LIIVKNLDFIVTYICIVQGPAIVPRVSCKFQGFSQVHYTGILYIGGTGFLKYLGYMLCIIPRYLLFIKKLTDDQILIIAQHFKKISCAMLKKINHCATLKKSAAQY